MYHQSGVRTVAGGGAIGSRSLIVTRHEGEDVDLDNGKATVE